jgi:hypothetical protein
LSCAGRVRQWLGTTQAANVRGPCLTASRYVRFSAGCLRCPQPSTMTDHDALVQQLVTAGLLETFTDDDGDQAMRLTP